MDDARIFFGAVALAVVVVVWAMRYTVGGRFGDEQSHPLDGRPPSEDVTSSAAANARTHRAAASWLLTQVIRLCGCVHKGQR